MHHGAIIWCILWVFDNPLWLVAFRSCTAYLYIMPQNKQLFEYTDHCWALFGRALLSHFQDASFRCVVSMINGFPHPVPSMKWSCWFCMLGTHLVFEALLLIIWFRKIYSFFPLHKITHHWTLLAHLDSCWRCFTMLIQHTFRTCQKHEFVVKCCAPLVPRNAVWNAVAARQFGLLVPLVCVRWLYVYVPQKLIFSVLGNVEAFFVFAFYTVYVTAKMKR